MSVLWQSINPGPFHPQALIDALHKAIDDTIDDAEDEFQDTVDTWTEPAYFEKDFDETTAGYEGEVKTDNLIYFFLTRGTSVRYATMSQDFESKTLPNWMSSRLGRGGLLFIDRTRPRPGIEARNWDKVEAKKQQPLLVKRAKKNLREGVRRSGHGI
jgi:hypothetical protein